jgi:hypothetical protein
MVYGKQSIALAVAKLWLTARKSGEEWQKSGIFP